jgi:hypothetical protein
MSLEVRVNFTINVIIEYSSVNFVRTKVVNLIVMICPNQPKGSPSPFLPDHFDCCRTPLPPLALPVFPVSLALPHADLARVGLRVPWVQTKDQPDKSR